MYKKNIVKKKEKKDIHICSECIGEFSSKDIFTAQVPNAMIPHDTSYCEKCLKELGIKEFKPYLKPREPRKKTEKTKNSTTEKTKNSTTGIKISDVRIWLKKFNLTQQNKLSKKHFDKNIKDLTTPQLKQLYQKEN